MVRNVSDPVRASEIFPRFSGTKTFIFLLGMALGGCGSGSCRQPSMVMSLFKNGFNIQHGVEQRPGEKLDPDKLHLKSCIR